MYAVKILVENSFLDFFFCARVGAVNIEVEDENKETCSVHDWFFIAISQGSNAEGQRSYIKALYHHLKI